MVRPAGPLREHACKKGTAHLPHNLPPPPPSLNRRPRKKDVWGLIAAGVAQRHIALISATGN